MLIIENWKMAAVQLGGSGEKSFRQQDFGNSRIAFEQWLAERLDQYAQTQVRTPGMERGESWGQENDVSEGAKTDD